MHNDVLSDNKLNFLIVLLLCISLSASNQYETISSFNFTFNIVKRQISGFTGCILLNHPPNGRRRLLYSKDQYVPNKPVGQTTRITVDCNEGYRVKDLEDGKPPEAFCINGEWVGVVDEDICLKIYHPYYWRMYDGNTIPKDAVLTEGDNVFVARVGFCFENDLTTWYYPATVNSLNKTITTAAWNRETAVDNTLNTHMILCTSEPERLRWEYVNIAAVQGNFLNKLVRFGYYLGYIYAGKAFDDNQWKIGVVYPYGHGQEVPGLKIWNAEGNGMSLNDFQILTFH